MYRNLSSLLRNKKISMKDYAEFLGVSEKTIHNKMNGATEFTLGEAMKTCAIICPEYKLDFVFESTE